MPRMLLRTLVPTVGAALAFAAPAQAAPTWLDPEAPFGDAPTLDRDAGAAMAPDGTIVVARFAPSGDARGPRAPAGWAGRRDGDDPAGRPRAPAAAEPGGADRRGRHGRRAVRRGQRPLRVAARARRAVARAGRARARPAGSRIGGDRSRRRALDRRRGLPARRAGCSCNRLSAGGTVRSTPLPAPPAGAEDLNGVIAAPKAGGVRVAYLRRRYHRGAAGLHGDRLDPVHRGRRPRLRRSSTATKPPARSSGTSAIPRPGTIVGPFLRAATGIDGSQTVAYAVLRLAEFEVSTVARHREAD